MDKDLVFEKLLGKSKPVVYKALFVTTYFGGWNLMTADSGLLDYIRESIGEVSDLEELLGENEIKKLPKEIGFHSCDIELYSFRCNRFDDPEEWDVKITVSNIVKVTDNSFFEKFNEISGCEFSDKNTDEII